MATSRVHPIAAVSTIALLMLDPGTVKGDTPPTGNNLAPSESSLICGMLQAGKMNGTPYYRSFFGDNPNVFCMSSPDRCTMDPNYVSWMNSTPGSYNLVAKMVRVFGGSIGWLKSDGTHVLSDEFTFQVPWGTDNPADGDDVDTILQSSVSLTNGNGPVSLFMIRSSSAGASLNVPFVGHFPYLVEGPSGVEEPFCDAGDPCFDGQGGKSYVLESIVCSARCDPGLKSTVIYSATAEWVWANDAACGGGAPVGVFEPIKRHCSNPSAQDCPVEVVLHYSDPAVRQMIHWRLNSSDGVIGATMTDANGDPNGYECQVVLVDEDSLPSMYCY